jgi:hypothetical protein
MPDVQQETVQLNYININNVDKHFKNNFVQICSYLNLAEVFDLFKHVVLLHASINLGAKSFCNISSGSFELLLSTKCQNVLKIKF